MSTAAREPEKLYFPSPDTREAFAGHREALLVLLALAAAAVIAVAAVISTIFGPITAAIFGFIALMTVAAFGMRPMYSGQQADQALSRASRSLWSRLRRRGRHVGGTPVTVSGVTDDGFTAKRLQSHAPPEFFKMEFMQEITDTNRIVAVLHDRLTDGYTAVMQIAPPAAASLDSEAFSSMMTAWDNLLAAGSSRAIRRIQVVMVTCPDDDGTELYRHYFRNRVDGDPAADANYRELLLGAGPSSAIHEAYVAVQVHGATLAGRVPLGERRRMDRNAVASQLLISELAELADRARRVGIDVVNDALSPRELATVWRTIYAPDDRPDVHRRNDRVPRTEDRGVSWEGTFPIQSDDTHPDYYVTDGSAHVAWWLNKYPAEAHERFIEALLLAPTVPRVFAITMEPLSGPAERYRMTGEKIKTDIAAENRQERKFITTTERADRDRQMERYDREINDNWQPVAYSAYVVGTAPTVDDVSTVVEDIRDAASLSGIELRRARQVHRQIFGFCLPGMMRGVGSHRGRSTLSASN